MLKKLRASGIRRIVMLTGDHPEIAEVVARELGIEEWRAEVLPEDKLEVVRQLQDEGHVVGMVGDGINDAQRWRPPTSESPWGWPEPMSPWRPPMSRWPTMTCSACSTCGIWERARSKSSARTTACRSRSTPPG
ncbi:HAD ATPase, P-type, IC family protein [Mycobacterium xenopi 3993]|nr:HAD ATPase, P-type, IC family protein [Mycobacterium xenopi 3993]